MDQAERRKREIRAKSRQALANVPLLATPLCNSYGSSLPSVFLWEIGSLAHLAHEQQWLARDGLVPLLRFFQKYPEPGRCRFRLLIHWSLRSVIPEAWQRRCRLYRLETSPERPRPEKPRHWVTCSIAAPAFASLDHVKRILGEIAKDRQLASLRESAPIVGAIQNEYDRLGTERTGGYHVEFVRCLLETFKGRFELASTRDLWMLGSLKDAIVLDFNERLICADDFNLEGLMKKGAWTKLAPLPGRLGFIPLSGQHGFGVYSIPRSLASVWEDRELLRLKNYLAESYKLVPPVGRYGDYPWPLWMEEFGAIVAKKLRSVSARELR